MRDGLAKSSSFRICVFGPENSGKTCLISTLFDEEFAEQNSTQGADVQICTIFANNWQKCTALEFADQLQHQFLHNLKITATEQINSPSFESSSPELPSTSNVGSAMKSESHPATPSKPKLPEVKVEVIKEAKAIKVIRKDGFIAVVWDFAGQIQYLSTHTVFMRKNNVIFIVVKASSNLSGPIEARPGDQESSSSSKATHFSVIHYWLQSVTSVCQDKGGEGYKSMLLPTVVLVFTHIDEIIGDIEQAKEEIIAQLVKELKGKPYAKHLAGNLPGVGLLDALKKYCVFLSNKVRNKKIIDQLKEIVQEISAPSMKEEYPLIYLKVEKELFSLEKELITTKEFCKIAVDNGFTAEEDSEEMKGALEYFHQKGVILHFPSINNLKHLVFLSPQWLEKLIAFLIIAHHYKPTGDEDDDSYDRLKYEGVLVGSFLDHMLQMFNKLHRAVGCEVSFDQAITCLTKFGFIAEISNKAEFLEELHPWSKEEERRIFIVPSQLPADKGERKLSFIEEKRVWSIHFVFPDGFISLTVFHQMVAECINWNGKREQNIAW